MAFICIEKCKCNNCSHLKFDPDRAEGDHKSCYLEQDLKANMAEYEAYINKILAIMQNKK